MEYPKDIRKELRVVTYLLIDIYDLVLKKDEKENIDEKSKLEMVEDEEVN
jgi:hypothetical protein